MKLNKFKIITFALVCAVATVKQDDNNNDSMAMEKHWLLWNLFTTRSNGKTSNNTGFIASGQPKDDLMQLFLLQWKQNTSLFLNLDF
jgi:hypothetical protein